MKNALNTLSAKRLKMQNPALRGMQKASDEVRQRMMKGYESERARLLAMREEQGLEDEFASERGARMNYEREQRAEVGKTAEYLMKKGYPRIQAQALAMAFGKEMAGLKEELSGQIGEEKTKVVLKEMREELLSIFKSSTNMGQLLREAKSQEKEFSQSILAQVRNEVFQRHNIPTE